MNKQKHESQITIPLFWLQNEFEDLQHFNHPKDCVLLALKVLERMMVRKKHNISIVCGSISTPKDLPMEIKLKRFQQAIDYVRIKTDDTVFDQIIFEQVFLRFHKAWQKENGKKKYPMPILEDFYLPVFASGFITQAYFIPGWQHSFGASWERKQLKKLQIPIYDLLPTWQEEYLIFLKNF